jgi:glycosyltransferase involved in cell wall biosynthesis
MNILLITQLFPADEDAKYTSGALREFALEWARNGHQVKVIRPYFSYEKEPFPGQPKFKLHDSLEIEFIRPLRLPLLKWNFYDDSRIIRNLNFKPDVVICHLYNSYFTFSKLAKKLQVPMIIGIHMSDLRISENWFYRMRQQIVFRNASAFACRSYVYMKMFRQRFPEYSDKCFAAISGIPETYLNAKVKDNTSEKIQIISVSHLEKRKQLHRVLKALAKLPETIDWTYKIVGRGPEEPELKSLIMESRIENKVNFTGQIKRDQVIEELLASDVFILPSHHETLGLVYLESMACGCITIGSLNEGIDGIIQDRVNGFLCDATDDSSIFDKLLEALLLKETERKNIIRQAHQTVASFSVKKKSEEYIDNIKKILK